MSTILILGGGFGGLACARALRARLGPEYRITLIDRSGRFVVGAAKTWVMLGERNMEEVVSPRARLLPPGVEYREEEILSIDPRGREVRTRAGSRTGEHLVLALGAEPDMTAVPGLADAAETFYTLEGADRLRERLEGFRGGRLVLLIPRTPFPCPPAPYEASFLLHAWLGRRRLREKTQLEVWTVEKAPMATAGPEMGKRIVGELEARGIGFHPMKKAVEVNLAHREVRFEDGSGASYDLLIAIPTFHVPAPVLAAGLAERGGWIPVDPSTLRVKSAGAPERVYAIGDVAGVSLPGRYDPAVPLALPKAGVMAAAQGETVAARIAAEIAGRPGEATFQGKGHCYIETGEGRAMRGDGSFFETPHPVMTARAPDEEQYREKVAWVREWLETVPEG